MRAINLRIVHAFAHGGRGGNPAGLVLEADELSPAEKQEVARRAGLSETAFVSHSHVADLKLEFFTPTRQIPHCGHATIAAFSYLKAMGRFSSDRASKETIDGIREIFFEDDLAFMEQRAPVFHPIGENDRKLALRALGLNSGDLLPGRQPEIVNTGNSFLILPVREAGRLAFEAYDQKLVGELSDRYGLVGFYPFAPGEEAQFAATSRMFAPAYGIPEESATGMAAGPLAAYLDHYGLAEGDALLIEQGRFMQPPSPSRLLVRLERTGRGIGRLFAGGSAYLAGERIIHLPAAYRR